MGEKLVIAIPVVKTSHGYIIYAHWGRAEGFAIYEVENGKYRLIDLVMNPYKDHEGRGKGQRLVNLLLSHGVNTVITYNIGPGMFEKLRSAGVKIYLTDKIDLIDNVVERFIKGELREADKPTEQCHHH